MKAYFVETNAYNSVMFTDGKTAKFFNAVPSGIFEGVDLYSDNAVERLREMLKKLYDDGNMEDFNSMWTSDEMPIDDLAEEMEDAVLVFDDGEILVEYQCGQSRSGEGIADYMRAEIDGVELYAEAEPVEGDETGTYDELRAEIIRQAEENGIDTGKLQFWFD